MAPGTLRPKSFLAPNPGPFTLEGTRSYVVGEGVAAVIDPGPSIDSHLAVLAEAVAGATDVAILLTHAHDDHAAGAARLACLSGGCVLGPGSDRDLEDGERIHTSAGDLVAVSTPGHARRHFCFHHPGAAAVFVGDLILGAGDTTWIGQYRGGVADYLESLDRVAALDAGTLYPAHGAAIHDPPGPSRAFAVTGCPALPRSGKRSREGMWAPRPSPGTSTDPCPRTSASWPSPA